MSLKPKNSLSVCSLVIDYVVAQKDTLLDAEASMSSNSQSDDIAESSAAFDASESFAQWPFLAPTSFLFPS